MSLIFPTIIWVLMGAITAYIAKNRGRDPYIWFAIGMVLGIFAIILLMLMSPVIDDDDDENPSPKNDKVIAASTVYPVMIEDVPVKEWYYIDRSGQQQGPMGMDVIKNLWSTHAIDGKSFVWCEGMDQWKRIEEIPRFLKDQG